MRTHCAASRRFGTETRTPMLPGRAGGAQTLTVAPGAARRCVWVAAADGGAEHSAATASAARSPPRAVRRASPVAVTASPYRACGRRESRRVGARGVRMAALRHAALAADQRAAAAPLE